MAVQRRRNVRNECQLNGHLPNRVVVGLGFVSGAERGNSILVFVVVTPLAGFSLILQLRDMKKKRKNKQTKSVKRK